MRLDGPSPAGPEPLDAIQPLRRPAETPAPPVRRADGPVLAGLAGILGLGALAAWAGSVAVRSAPEAADAVVSVPIAGRPVSLPAAWLRGREGEILELRIPLDAFAGAAAPADAMVLVRIAPREEAVGPAERAAQLYARFLSPAAASGEGGLIRREFRAGTPFEGETLHLAPPDGRAFAARCVERAPGGARETCLAEIRTGAADLRLRLAPEHLGHWQAVVRGLQRLAGA